MQSTTTSGSARRRRVPSLVEALALSLGVVAPLISGCLAEVDEGTGGQEPTELGSAEQAVSSSEIGPLDGPGAFQIPGSAETVFLSGVLGNWAASGSSASRVVIDYGPKDIGVVVTACMTCANSIFVKPCKTKGSLDMSSDVVQPPKVRALVTNHGGTMSPTKLASSDGHTACYLDGVGNLSASHDAFGSSTDRLTVSVVGQDWVATGNGRVMASVGCIDVQSILGQTSATGGASGAIATLGADQPGKVCALTGIGGKFRSNSTSDGVRVYLDAGTWKLAVGPGKCGQAACHL